MDGFLQANQSLMRQFGETATYKKIYPAVYDVNTSSVGSTESNFEILARVSMPRLSEQESPNLIGKDSRAIFVLPDSRYIPEVNDKIQVKTVFYTVKSVITQQGYAGTIVGYKLLCVRG
jgi:hypothetical protein